MSIDGAECERLADDVRFRMDGVVSLFFSDEMSDAENDVLEPLYAEEDDDKSSDTSITVRLRVLDDTIASRLNGNVLDEFSRGKNTRAERSIILIA